MTINIPMIAAMTATAAAIGCLASPAAAQSEFTGPRAEIGLGWDNFSPGGGNGSSDSKDDLVYGGSFGYDFETGGFVIGGEVELTGSGVSATWSGVTNPGDYLSAKAGRDIYVGVRAGYAFTPNIMAYAKAGYTNLDFDTTYNAALPGSNTIEDHVGNDGFRVGIGAEYRMTSGVYVKGEYRYSHYGDNIGPYDVDIDRNQVSLVHPIAVGTQHLGDQFFERIHQTSHLHSGDGLILSASSSRLCPLGATAKAGCWKPA